MEKDQKISGFGLLGIIIVVAFVVSFSIGGGFYWNETKKQQSLLQTGADAIKRAEELKQAIESRQEQIYGGSTSINSSAAPTSKNDILSSIPTIEQAKLFTIARSYVLSHSTSGIEFGIVPEKIINNCVKFSVIAKHRETDDAQLFIIKINGVWTPIAFGTAFPNLYFDHPECSESGISNWKTYRNEKYRFEVKYPTFGILSEVKENGSDFNFRYSSSSQGSFELSYSIRLYTNISESNLESWFRKNITSDDGIKYTISEYANGALLKIDSIPPEFVDKYGPLFSSNFFMPSSRKFVLTIYQALEPDLSQFSQKSGEERRSLLTKILLTFRED